MRVTPSAGDLAGEHRLRPGGLDKALRRQIVDLGRPVLAQNADQRDLVHQVAGDKRQIVLNMVDALEIDRRRAADHADHVVALLEQKLGQIAAVLAGDAGDQCRFFMCSSSAVTTFRDRRACYLPGARTGQQYNAATRRRCLLSGLAASADRICRYTRA